MPELVITVTPELIVVNGSDPLLMYSRSGWTSTSRKIVEESEVDGTRELHDLRSSRGTSTPGTISFGYNGSCIQVYGSLDGAADDKTANWACYVDGNRIKGSIAPRIFAKPSRICDGAHATVSNGPHIFTLVVNSVPRNRTFWLDWLSYAPSIGVSREDFSTLLLPHNSAISYHRTWLPHDEDSAKPTAAGSTLTVGFTGTSASWYWTVPQTSAPSVGQATYSVDGAPTVFTRTTDITSSTPEFEAEPRLLKTTQLGSPSDSPPLTLSRITVESRAVPSSTATPIANPYYISGALYKHLMVIFGSVLGGALGIFVIGLMVACYFWSRKERRVIDEQPLVTLRRASPNVTAPNFVP
ncbi:hypothetical protein NP233_g2038 [Leucocoprinus birnbaumii]|uniref:Uncharacterized protein n=1 Tax=Leucocoprinus birnbaumii TaxID=56174 RepID=A0AAD5W1G4_9AGAR|nr:hypothetical protein NP233_g2038 [Leucocoprinus birnbaumii]